MDSSKSVAKEFLLSLKHDTGYIQSNKIEQIDIDRGENLKLGSFESMKLPTRLIEKLHEKKFNKPSLVQNQVIPVILEGKSVVVQSQSGSGKTYAFAIGILPGIVADGTTQALIITPTKELSFQITNEINSLAPCQNVSATNLNLKEGLVRFSEICVGCPGTILNLLENFLCLKYLVIDEADFMLNPLKMGKETLTILKLINARQRLYFSATYSNKIKRLIQEIEYNSFLSNYNSELMDRLHPKLRNYLIENPKYSNNHSELFEFYETSNRKPETIKLFHTLVAEDEKIDFLLSLFDFIPISQLIIFVSRKDKINIIKKRFEKEKFLVSFIHGDMTLEERKSSVRSFVDAKTKILISTDLLSRGMDISLVNAVINFDIPMSPQGADVKTYIHRIGRCGRFGRNGFTLDFCSSEHDLQAIKELSEHLEFENKYFDRTDLEGAWEEIELRN